MASVPDAVNADARSLFALVIPHIAVRREHTHITDQVLTWERAGRGFSKLGR